MQKIALEYVKDISLFVGFIGIFIILIGAVLGIFRYINPKYNQQEVRLILGNHIILGLDFLVGKDIIDTLLLDGTSNANKFWMDLAGLFTVVIIRIILTYFTGREIKDIRKETQRNKKTESSFKLGNRQK